MREIRVQAVLDNLDTVISFIEEELERAECPLGIVMKINLSVEEIFVNIANYAYEDHVGEAVIRTEIRENPHSIRITFIDYGVPYDPTALPEPDVSSSAEERKIGGLGIFLVRKNMDSMTYEYKDGSNILVIEKNL